MYLYKDITKISDFDAFLNENEAKKGDNILVIADSESYTNARALCDTAREIGCNAVILDVDMYGGKEGYDNIPIMEPVRQAILHADITFMTTPQIKTGFSTYLGSQDDGDESLLGKSKRFTFESGGMEDWNINKEEVLNNRKRALCLYNWVKNAKQLHITTKRGTDFTCDISKGLDAIYPVMGIIPFYSEVAVIPSFNTVNGVVVADGASERTHNQRGFPIRPNMPTCNELYKEPIRLTFKDSYLTDFSGDDDLIRSAALGYHSALISEALRSGVDEVLIFAGDIPPDRYAELARLALEVKRLCPDGIIGISLPVSAFADAQNSTVIDELWNAFDYFAADLTHCTGGEVGAAEQISGELGQMLYYLLRYNARVLLPYTQNADELSLMIAAVNDSGSENIQIMPQSNT